MKHIFICYTPLHVLIVEKIIQKHAIGNFIFVGIINKNKEKTLHYFDKLIAKSERNVVIDISGNFFINYIKIVLTAIKLNKYKKKNKIYLGQVKTFYSRLFCHLLKPVGISSFDDGIGNLNTKGYFYIPTEKLISNVYFSVFNSSLLYRNFLSQIEKHYTIYPNNPFCKGKQLFLKVFDEINTYSNLPGYKILISSPFSELNLLDFDKEQRLISKIIEYYKIDEVIAHPAENNIKFKDLKIKLCDSNLIAEEYIYSLSNKYNLEIFGFNSSVLLNLALISKIKLMSFKVGESHIYELFRGNNIFIKDVEYLLEEA